MTKREAAIVSAYTGYLLGDFSDMHKYVEEIMGRPVWTHEMGSREISDIIKEKSKGDYINIEVTEDSITDLMLRIVELEKANRMYRERDRKHLHMEGLVRQMIREKKEGQISIRTLGKIDNLLGVE